jgi:LmbE family N-acetylglucosaminyl deacetylase
MPLLALHNFCMKNLILTLSLCLSASAFGIESNPWKVYMKGKLSSMPELKTEYLAMPSWNSGTILMVYAHADDELGVVAEVARLQSENPNLKFKWVMVSDNAKGKIVPGSCGKKSKAECRLLEAKIAAQCMGIPAPTSLGVPDGGVDKVQDLARFIEDRIPEFHDPDLRAVFSNDFRGLYGHADHVAVHDAVAEIMKGSGIPLIGMAVPNFIGSHLPMRAPGKFRKPMPITHAVDLSHEDAILKGCVTRAHKSQYMTLRILMLQFLRPEDVYTWAPREFYTIIEN